MAMEFGLKRHGSGLLLATPREAEDMKQHTEAPELQRLPVLGIAKQTMRRNKRIGSVIFDAIEQSRYELSEAGLSRGELAGYETGLDVGVRSVVGYMTKLTALKLNKGQITRKFLRRMANDPLLMPVASNYQLARVVAVREGDQPVDVVQEEEHDVYNSAVIAERDADDYNEQQPIFNEMVQNLRELIWASGVRTADQMELGCVEGVGDGLAMYAQSYQAEILRHLEPEPHAPGVILDFDDLDEYAERRQN